MLAKYTAEVHSHRDSTELLCIHSRDGAWAEADSLRTVTQGGPRQIWDEVERTATLWFGLGRPRADRFGLTATTERHRFWLDTPDSPISTGAPGK